MLASQSANWPGSFWHRYPTWTFVLTTLISVQHLLLYESLSSALPTRWLTRLPMHIRLCKSLVPLDMECYIMGCLERRAPGCLWGAASWQSPSTFSRFYRVTVATSHAFKLVLQQHIRFLRYVLLVVPFDSSQHCWYVRGSALTVDGVIISIFRCHHTSEYITSTGSSGGQFIKLYSSYIRKFSAFLSTLLRDIVLANFRTETWALHDTLLMTQ